MSDAFVAPQKFPLFEAHKATRKTFLQNKRTMRDVRK